MSVSATMGVLGPVLRKLADLAGNEYSKLKGVRKQASFLEKEISAMAAALQKMELMNELDPHDRDWRDHVREMSYDMENCIDDFMRQFGGAHADVGFIEKILRSLKTLRQRHRISESMEELKNLALETSERRMRYKNDECNRTSSFVSIDPNSGFVAIDSRMATLYMEAAGLVGTDGPRKEIGNLLTDTEKRLKVVSIVGFGGLGKTTIAKRVYDEIGGKFDCKAIVPVSQRPNLSGLMTLLLYRIRKELKLEMNGPSQSCGVQDIIDDLREHLKCKRYLIVVDDLWDLSTWNTIKCAFPENANGSRVLVTTRLEGVACEACYNHPPCIYRMKPLEKQDSKMLFYHRLYGSEHDHASQLEEISDEILKKCGGLPLAIITIASLLASRPERLRAEWEIIRNSLGAQFAVNPTLEGMMSILNLSYIHLPLHLRACLLHLGIYPEDHEIERDDLVRQWSAEGLVSKLHGQDSEIVAQSYFNELLNRSLIQPGRTEYGELVSCRVHDMMLDLILSKCEEHNFLRVECNPEDMARDDGRKYKARRISMNFINGGATNEIASGSIPSTLSKVRSVALFGESKYMPPLLHFKYLRVLLFKSLGDKVIDLTDISQLFELRYLKVSSEGKIKLPTKMQGLVHLETLDLHCKWAVEIPSDIVNLPRLSHLEVTCGGKCGGKVPKGIRKMKSLRTLIEFYLDSDSLEDIEGLGELTSLRRVVLSVSFLGRLEIAAWVALAHSIEMLRDLRYLRIICHASYTSDLLGSLSNPSRHMKVLELRPLRMPRVPKWIYGLQCLCRLELNVETCTDEFHALGELPTLVDLRLQMCSIPEDSTVIFSAGSFPVLEYCTFESEYDVTAYLAFGAGAMPKLRFLDLRFNKSNWGGATPVGLEHLLSLEYIVVSIICGPQEMKEEAKSAFRNCTRLHPNRPLFYIL